MNASLRLMIAILSLLPLATLAQAGFESDVDSELDQLYANPVQQGQQVQSQRPQVAPQQVSGQPIYILNQGPQNTSQQQSAAQIQKQPTTYIEATPMNESQADRMRKARQDAELHTETKIVEKLEMSRMEDEKRRAQVLFGDKFDKLNNQEGQQQQAPAQQQPVAPAPVPVQVIQANPPQENTRDIIREELQAAMKTEQEVPEQPVESKYFGGLAGIGEYPDVSNVTGNYALGFTFGTKYDNTYAMEGSFIYSNYTLKNVNGYGQSVGGYNQNQDVNQYAGSLAMKYYLFSGMVKPVLGGIAQYSYRTYTWSKNTTLGNSQNQDVNSHAFDIGALVGADIEFSKKASIGVDLRYLYNVASRKNAGNLVSYPGTTDLEKLNYYVMSITGRVTF